MRGLPELPEEYFDKYKDTPVKIKPYNPKTKQVAEEYIKILRGILSEYDIEYLHRGSTAFRIAGKGDIEIGLYPPEDLWDVVLEKLKDYYGKVENLEENYARFNDISERYEIEIIMMRGHDADIDKKLTEYLVNNPAVLKEYEDVKNKYSFSRKEYMIQKDKFLRNVVKMIPNSS